MAASPVSKRGQSPTFEKKITNTGAMVLTEINEEVEVIAFFGKNRTIPYIVRWGGRQFKVQKINLSHQTWEGQTKLFFFNATCEGASLRLRFNTAGLSWHLEQIWTE